MKLEAKVLIIIILMVYNIPAQENGKDRLNLEGIEAIEWAKKNGLLVEAIYPDGRCVSLVGIRNGVPEYYTTFDESSFKTANYSADSVELERWAKENNTFIDTLFNDGSRLQLVDVRDAKPIYRYSIEN